MQHSETGQAQAGDLGARIRTLRTARRLSVRAVAVRAGLSASFLSQFERGLSDVSVGSLRKICHAMGITPAEVMGAEPPTTQSVIRADERRKLTTSPGIRKYPVSSSPAEAVEVYIGEVDPSFSTADEPYAHGDSVEIVYVLAGTALYHVDGRQTELRAGDSIEHRTSSPHLLSNRGDELVRVMWIIAPPA